MESPIEVLFYVVRVLEDIHVPYVVVGSFASSARGLSRATGDVDIVADLKPAHLNQFITKIEGTFYLEEQALRRAVNNQRSFNVIHYDSIFKVDIFVPPDNGFGRQQLARRQLEHVTPDATQAIYLATAEDIMLAKLLWYREGGEVSDRQWADVLGVIKVQGTQLDAAYLREWAARLNVSDLLEKALSEAR